MSSSSRRPFLCVQPAPKPVFVCGSPFSVPVRVHCRFYFRSVLSFQLINLPSFPFKRKLLPEPWPPRWPSRTPPNAPFEVSPCETLRLSSKAHTHSLTKPAAPCSALENASYHDCSFETLAQLITRWSPDSQLQIQF